MARDENPVIVTPTASMKESKGVAFGLEGDLFLYMVFGIMAGIGLLIVCQNILKMSMLSSVMTAAFPLVIVFIYLKLFRINKPPHYQEDIFEGIFSASAYVKDQFQCENPFYTKIIEKELRIKKVPVIEKKGEVK